MLCFVVPRAWCVVRERAERRTDRCCFESVCVCETWPARRTTCTERSPLLGSPCLAFTSHRFEHVLACQNWLLPSVSQFFRSPSRFKIVRQHEKSGSRLARLSVRLKARECVCVFWLPPTSFKFGVPLMTAPPKFRLLRRCTVPRVTPCRVTAINFKAAPWSLTSVASRPPMSV